MNTTAHADDPQVFSGALRRLPRRRAAGRHAGPHRAGQPGRGRRARLRRECARGSLGRCAGARQRGPTPRRLPPWLRAGPQGQADGHRPRADGQARRRQRGDGRDRAQPAARRRGRLRGGLAARHRRLPAGQARDAARALQRIPGPPRARGGRHARTRRTAQAHAGDGARGARDAGGGGVHAHAQPARAAPGQLQRRARRPGRPHRLRRTAPTRWSATWWRSTRRVLVSNLPREQRFEVPARLLEAGAKSCVGGADHRPRPRRRRARRLVEPVAQVRRRRGGLPAGIGQPAVDQPAARAGRGADAPRRSGWRRWASSPAAWPTTSTTC